MEKEEATRTCGQCHKEVAESNFALHETHCKRFLCLCPDCDEPVPREQLDQHREEQHTQVRCSKCNQKMERCKLLDHETDDCVERLQSCQFCELELPWKELDRHGVACGSRTELCRDCGRYVKLKDQPDHGSTCSPTDNGSDPPKTTSKLPTNNTKLTVSCRRCMTSVPMEDLDEHELKCIPTTRSDDEEDESEEEEEEREEVSYFSSRGAATLLNSNYNSTLLSAKVPGAGPWGDGDDPNTISTCPHCHLALPLPTLRRHQVKCQNPVLRK